MKREFLQELGLEKEAIDKIMAQNGTDINEAKKGVEAMEKELETARESIKAFQKETGEKSIEELKKQLTELQGKYDTDVQALQNDLQQTRLNGALEAAMTKSGAKNTKALRGLLDMEKIQFQDGALTGFEEQIEQIKAENDYLFNEPKSWGQRHTATAPQKDGVEEAFEALNPHLRFD